MTGDAAGPLRVSEIRSGETLPLRAAVLRPGYPPEDCGFDGDDDPGTSHFGVVNDDGDVLGVASVYTRDHPELGDGGHQIRGMAVSGQCRGLGLGDLLLRALEDTAIEAGARYLWANARTEALGFYSKRGYSVRSQEFIIETVGPHYLVSKALV